MPEKKYRASKMRDRYSGAHGKDLGAKKSVWEIGMDTLCDCYRAHPDYPESLQDVCDDIAKRMESLRRKDGKRVFTGEPLYLEVNRNGRSRKGFYMGSAFWTKPPRTGMHKVYVEKDVLRLVGPGSLEFGDAYWLIFGNDKDYVDRMSRRA